MACTGTRREITVQKTTLLDDVGLLLRNGTLARVRFVQQADEVPDMHHDRVVLTDLLGALHRQADADGDGFITCDEMNAFLDRNRLLHLGEFLPPSVAHGDALSFVDFKSFLLGSSVITLDGGSSYGVQSSLVGVVSEACFDATDTDFDGTITLPELEAMFRAHGMGDASAAVRAMGLYDRDNSSTIDRREFLSLLLDERLVTVNLTKVQRGWKRTTTKP